MIFEGVIQW